eukprot:3098105-Prymnesium_polylepis.1
MPPPLNPVQAGFSPSERQPMQVELFLDLICPFSRKMFAAVFESGKVYQQPGADGAPPWLAAGHHHPLGVTSFVLHQVPQPWHPQGTYVHEAALAVKHVAPDKYLAFCAAVYKAYDAGKFQDKDTWDKSRAQ